jgi:hypothetical protein
MTHQLLLELPDDVFQPLARQAAAAGRPLAAVAAECLARAVRPLQPSDALRRWAGAIDSGVPDLADRHDHYIGQGLCGGSPSPRRGTADTTER